MQIRAAFSHSLLEMLIDAVGYKKLRVFRPAIELLYQPDLLNAQRLSVRFVGILFVGRPVTDVAVDDDQCRTVFRLQEGLISPSEHFEIVRVGDSSDVPSVAQKSRGYIFRKRPARR